MTTKDAFLRDLALHGPSFLTDIKKRTGRYVDHLAVVALALYREGIVTRSLEKGKVGGGGKDGMKYKYALTPKE